MAILLLAVAPALLAQAPARKAEKAEKVQQIEKIEPVAVVGCLEESAPDTWMLVNASDPRPSSAVAPSEKELAALPKSGKNQFQLVGATAVFNLPAHRGHSVVVKGLPLTGTPVGRLNVTSVTMVAATCPAASTPK
ncbi:MAG TPA: hypothetical protein VMO26_01715 [Vicinamibacterales bacterium]|nr:hypothetical protein [Vicinamibacterales bacterium]